MVKDDSKQANPSGFVGLVLKAACFAAEKHRHQRRKDSLKSPYINHPLEVAERIWNTGECHDPEVICAAILHDTVEDTEATFKELEAVFGKTICELVREVTDDKSLPKARRKELQIEHAAHLSTSAKLIKLADKTSNVKDIHLSPPPDWSLARRHEYLDWTAAVVEQLRGTNQAMEEAYFATLAEARLGLKRASEEMGSPWKE
ncbi:MAG: bifunctional (p)ppGpp synthetase/guanosine-3',5'-bis(diphosphate) 3'-pyrophosphohydrolase [Candidatus Competibacteraceae bacterium]|nr:bifunctional (p)ppGpp synthetase/guanosine-3',5'-bis(diphosphate) 3'-pyrophosphohydrolase [Candidatus Competibacteraceae bacterium]